MTVGSNLNRHLTFQTREYYLKRQQFNVCSSCEVGWDHQKHLTWKNHSLVRPAPVGHTRCSISSPMMISLTDLLARWRGVRLFVWGGVGVSSFKRCILSSDLKLLATKCLRWEKRATTNISAPVTTASFFLFYFSSHHSAKVMLGHFRMKRCTFCYYLAQSVKSSSAISSSRV